MRTEPDVTEEQLAMAVRHMRRPHWPASLDAVLAHPIYGPAVRGVARNLQRGGFPVPAKPRHTLPCAPVPPTPAFPPHRTPVYGGGRKPFDPKKAAANDRDD